MISSLVFKFIYSNSVYVYIFGHSGSLLVIELLVFC